MKFEINNLPAEIQLSMKNSGVWSEECPVPMSKLRLLELSHYNFANQVIVGKMVVLDRVAESVILIFKELLALKFPIHNIGLIDEYNGDDELSMAANNSSCFNFRKIDGSDLLSMHSYGLAIDINPVQNPFIQKDKISPLGGKLFFNRENKAAGMVEPIIDIFYKYGFTIWGGSWKTPIDYHHFQVPRDQVEHLIK